MANYLIRLFSAPSIDSVIAVPLNGAIFIKWTLKHTGGLHVSIYSYCEVDELGYTTVDNVQSGQVYSCRVTAVNSKGSDTIIFNNVFSVEGKV